MEGADFAPVAPRNARGGLGRRFARWPARTLPDGSIPACCAAMRNPAPVQSRAFPARAMGTVAVSDVCQNGDVACCWPFLHRRSRSRRSPRPSTRPAGPTSSRSRAKHWMVAAANPHAVEAGYRDPARRAARRSTRRSRCSSCWGSTEPQSSGHRRRRVPAAARRAREAPRRVRRPRDRARGGDSPIASSRTASRSTSTTRWSAASRSACPGTVRLLETAHRKHGRLHVGARSSSRRSRWPRTASRCRRGCIGCSGREVHHAAAPARVLLRRATARCCRSGTVLRNPAYARTLRAIAAGGADAFYTGAIARDIVDTVTRPSVQSGRPHAGRSRELPGRRARAGVRRVSRAIASAASRCRRRAASRCCRC